MSWHGPAGVCCRLHRYWNSRPFVSLPTRRTGTVSLHAQSARQPTFRSHCRRVWAGNRRYDMRKMPTAAAKRAAKSSPAREHATITLWRVPHKVPNTSCPHTWPCLIAPHETHSQHPKLERSALFSRYQLCHCQDQTSGKRRLPQRCAVQSLLVLPALASSTDNRIRTALLAGWQRERYCRPGTNQAGRVSRRHQRR